MFKFINKIKNKEYSKEKGFSLLELSVAVGIAAIVGAAGIAATTTFIDTAETKKDNYLVNADGSIEDAESSSLALLQGNTENLVSIAPVSNTVASGATTDSVTISWAVPLGVSAPITSYTIFIDDTELETVDASVTSYELTELSAGTSYDVTIRATNSNGSEDATFTVVTESPTAPGVPTTVLASDITSTGATLTWAAPEDGEVEEYIITLDGVNQGEPLNGDVLSYELTGLTVNTEYEVGVFAKSPEGLTSDAGEERFSTFFKPMVASGGDEVYEIVQNDRVYRVHEFTTVGADIFEVESIGETGEVEYLVIGGGGGGEGDPSKGASGAGGGAGGYRTNVSGELSGGSNPAEESFTVSVGEHSVTVGAGGSPGSPGAGAVGSHGQSSSFSEIVSLGGGGGNNSSGVVGSSGGRGNTNKPALTNFSSSQGNSGGRSTNPSNTYRSGSGGGAGTAGGTAPGRGGAGLSSSITGSEIVRGGGGAGSSYLSGFASGGIGGGGGVYSSGQANTGGGGGAGHRGSWGGSGGSGIVIVRYPITAPFN